MSRHTPTTGSQKARATAPSDKAPATRVRSLRTQCGMSLSELADRVGLSVEELTELESSSEAPTIPVLWRLSTALRTPVGSLLSAPQERGSARALSPATGAKSRVSSRSLLSTAPGSEHTELSEVSLPRATSSVALPRSKGSRDTILVTSGSALIEVAGRQKSLKTGESYDVPSDVERRYTCLGEATATLYIVSKPGRALVREGVSLEEHPTSNLRAQRQASDASVVAALDAFRKRTALAAEPRDLQDETPRGASIRSPA